MGTIISLAAGVVCVGRCLEAMTLSGLGFSFSEVYIYN